MFLFFLHFPFQLNKWKNEIMKNWLFGNLSKYIKSKLHLITKPLMLNSPNRSRWVGKAFPRPVLWLRWEDLQCYISYHMTFLKLCLFTFIWWRSFNAPFHLREPFIANSPAKGKCSVSRTHFTAICSTAVKWRRRWKLLYSYVTYVHEMK